MKKVLSAFALMALVVVGLLLPAPASAAPGGVAMWKANAGSSLSGTMSGGNTSIETTDAFEARDVAAGTVLDLDYTLGEGATCIGGAPRVFATVGGTTVNSWDQHIADGVEAACKGEVTLPGGSLTAIGVVWDNGQEGTITVTSLKLGSDSLGFNEKTPLTVVDATKLPEPKYTPPTCDDKGSVVVPAKKVWPEGVAYAKKTTGKGGAEVTVNVTALDGYKLSEATSWTYAVEKLDPESEACKPSPSPSTSSPTPDDTGSPSESPSASASPTASATGTPSASSSATVVPGAVGGGDSGSLPKTGVKALTMFGVGGLLVAVGGILLVLLRRKRDQEPGMHRNDGDTQVFPAV